MLRLLAAFWRNESGETYVEYVMLAAMLSVIAVSLFSV